MLFLYAAAEGISLPGGDRGFVLQKLAQLEALEQQLIMVLTRCAGYGVSRSSQARYLQIRSGLPIYF